MLTVDYARLGVRPDDRVLDLGCGFGRHAYQAARLGAQVVAVDFGADEVRSVRDTFGAMADAGELDPVALYPTEHGFIALSRGRQSEVAAVDPLQGAAAGAAEETGEIVAPMTGRLIALFVAEGEWVEEGVRLAVVEAMKMEHALTAPRAGKIVGLSAAVGDGVEQGRLLMTVAEAAT